MANGRVLTGFSKPYVAVWSSTGYTSGTILARGVSVTVEADSSDSNDFYADNVVAESVSGTFTSGTCTLTVDGLLDAAEKLILGLPTATEDGLYQYGDAQTIPYVGIGFVARYMSDGATTYVPYILTKAKFKDPALSANTAEDSIDWQTQELEATLYKDGDGVWKMRGEGKTTEAAAEAVIKDAFSIS